MTAELEAEAAAEAAAEAVGQAELEERARVLFAGPIEFLKSAPALKFLPDPEVPEIACAGRDVLWNLFAVSGSRVAAPRRGAFPGKAA